MAIEINANGTTLKTDTAEEFAAIMKLIPDLLSRWTPTGAPVAEKTTISSGKVAEVKDTRKGPKLPAVNFVKFLQVIKESGKEGILGDDLSQKTGIKKRGGFGSCSLALDKLATDHKFSKTSIYLKSDENGESRYFSGSRLDEFLNKIHAQYQLLFDEGR